jgi:glucosyl-dolichyl phosphate glucuronosyltransferase
MKISVILCTFNRNATLPLALDSLAAQRLPDSCWWEVVVVDNNSTDATRATVGKYCERYPGKFRYLFEPEQGLSRARNAGIRTARGEILAFLDDDVVAEPNWLSNLTSSMADPRWAGAGGRIVPLHGFAPPNWLTLGGEMDLGGPLALFDQGATPGELKRAPYGANMAFRRDMFVKYGDFRVDLGRCGASLLSGEDTEFANRLIAASEPLRYEPSAVVHHPVPAERLNKRYFRNWWFDFGRGRIIERARRPAVFGLSREWFSIFHLLWHFLPARTMRWLLATSPQRRFYDKCQVWLTVGEIVQNYRLALSRERANPRLEVRAGLDQGESS